MQTYVLKDLSICHYSKNSKKSDTWNQVKSCSKDGRFSISLTLQKTPVLNLTHPSLWADHTKLVLILTPIGVSLLLLGVKFNTDVC